VISKRAQNLAAFCQSLASVSASPGVRETTARAAFTRPRRSRRRRASARSSSSCESSGRPDVISARVDLRVDVANPSSGSLSTVGPNPCCDSKRERGALYARRP
jgi:hypothetical protein